MDGYTLRGAAPVTGGEILTTVTDMLSCLGQARKLRKGEREAGLWDYTVPNSRRVTDLVRAYAEQGAKLHIAANGVEIGSLELENQSLICGSSKVGIGIRYSLMGSEEWSKQVSFDYPNPTAKMLLSGRWIDFGAAVLKLGQILPDIAWENGTAVLKWSGDPPEIKLGAKGIFGLMRRMTHTSLDEIRIGPDYGEFVARGLVGWGLPRLKWGE